MQPTDAVARLLQSLQARYFCLSHMFCRDCWAQEPATRPSIGEVVQRLSGMLEEERTGGAA